MALTPFQVISCENKAAIVMSFRIEVLDPSAGKFNVLDNPDSGNYPVGQSRQIDLSKIAGIAPGAIVRPQVRPEAGSINNGGTPVQFEKNNDVALYVVTGTALDST